MQKPTLFLCPMQNFYYYVICTYIRSFYVLIAQIWYRVYSQRKVSLSPNSESTVLSYTLPSAFTLA